MKWIVHSVAASAMLACASGAWAQKGETVKIGWIDPLSGLMAAVGTNQLKTFQLMAEEVNRKNASGVKFEIIPLDNKLSPQETTAVLRSAMDQGARYVVQGNGSGPALAIMDALEKHNARNKGKEVVYLNYAAVDPDLTNSKCSYWHFRLDADTSMKMEALTTYMKDLPEVKKVYLINQNYSHGQQVSKYAKEMLKRKRPDVEIVGDDFSPLAQVRDFAPYIAKIKQSGADSVITGNWGSDRKSTRLNSSHLVISYAVFCLKKKTHRPRVDLIFEDDRVRPEGDVVSHAHRRLGHTPPRPRHERRAGPSVTVPHLLVHVPRRP